MIKEPTIGRVLWYWPTAADKKNGIAYHNDCQPLAATVVHVWGDHMVNLSILDQAGNPFAKTSVTLLQEGDTVRRGLDGYAQWPGADIPRPKVHPEVASITVPPCVDAATGPAKGEATSGECGKAKPYDIQGEGQQAAMAVARHLVNMGAAGTLTSVELDGQRFTVVAMRSQLDPVCGCDSCQIRRFLEGLENLDL